MASEDDDFVPDKYKSGTFNLVVKPKPKPKFKPPPTNTKKKATCFKIADNKYLTKKKDEKVSPPVQKKDIPAAKNDENYP